MGVLSESMGCSEYDLMFNEMSTLTHACLKDEEVYTFDPLALHHILVKDQYIFEETTSFIE